MMKRYSSILVVIMCLTANVYSQALETFHDFSAATILGDTISLSDYYGKKVLVVNTATFCSFTPQYAELQQLDSLYSSYNFEVIGFPCNDFGSQEPEDDSTINEFCEEIYGVTFQMMSKVHIVTGDTAEVYKWLQLESRNGVADAAVTWNFHKFLIDEAGHWVNHFPSLTNPLDTAITNWILSPSVTPVLNPDNELAIKLIGNPVSEQLCIQFNNVNVHDYSIKLYSLEGKVVADLFSGSVIENSTLSFDVSTISKGLYLLSFESGTMNQLLKVMVVE